MLLISALCFHHVYSAMVVGHVLLDHIYTGYKWFVSCGSLQNIKMALFALFLLLQDDEDDDANEEEGGLSKSGKELKKLLGRSGGLNDSDAEEDDDDDDDVGYLLGMSSTL